MFCTTCAFHNSEPFGRCPVCGAEPAAMVRSGRLSATVAGSVPLRRTLDRILTAVTAVAILATALTAAAAIRERSEDRAAAYARGMDAAADGELVAALDAFDDAGDFRDAIARRQAVLEQLRVYDVAYVDGAGALREGRYDEAIAALLPVARDVPDYKDVLSLLDEARSERFQDLLRQAGAAVTAGDWRTAERSLALALADEPTNERVAADLASIRREHAPLIFTRDHRLYTVGQDLTDERLVTGEVAAAWPVWSPDRTRIAFVSPDGTVTTTVRRLYVVDADGANLRQLATDLRPYSWPVWSPDGSRIAYTGEATATSSGGWTVNVVDIASGRAVDLTTGKLPNGISPTWSPAGDRLAFVKRRTIGSSTNQSDGSLGSAAANSEIYVYSFATNQLERVGRWVPEPWRIAWSPAEDKLLVFSRADGTSYTRGSLYLLDLRTDEMTPVDTTTQDVSPAVWSPDGRRFAYVERGERLRVVALNGDGFEVPASEPLSRFIAWSPGGEAVFTAAASSAGLSQILHIEGDGETWSPVALAYDTDGMHAGPPQWSAINPEIPNGPPTYSGTAVDHAAVFDGE
jgi:Tol biopolymer transport system component